MSVTRAVGQGSGGGEVRLAEGMTLREHYGLARPGSQYARGREEVLASA
jgi:hypothetical protein